MTTNWWNVESAFYAGTPVLVKLAVHLFVWLVAAIWLVCLARVVSWHYALLLAAGHPVSAATLWRALAAAPGWPQAVSRQGGWRWHRHARVAVHLLAVAGLSALLVISWPWPGTAAPVLALAGLCLVCLAAAIDARTGYLPDALTWPLLGLGIIHAVLFPGFPSPAQALAGVAAGYGLPWVVAHAYLLWRKQPGLGGGDIKLLAAMGAWLGPAQVPWVLLLACLLALLGAWAGAVLRRQSWQARRAQPFGPALAAAGVGVFALQSALQCQFSVCIPAYAVRACTKLA